MSLKKCGARAAMLAAVIGLVLFYTGCGDVFRPVANPEPLPGGDPLRSAHAIVVSSNGSSPGTAVVIDVTGDTSVGSFSTQPFGMGRSPVHAAASGSTYYVANRDDDNVSSFTLPTVGIALNVSLLTLDAGAAPVFIAIAQAKAFVAESGLGQVVDLSNNQRIKVGNTPVAMVAPPSPNDTQLYVLNQGDNTVGPSVSVIFPATDQNVSSIPLLAGAQPIRAAASADGTRVVVVNQGTSTLSVINTVSNTIIGGPSCAQDTFCLGSGGPNYVTYEATSNRFYVTNPGDQSLWIIDNRVDTSQCVAVNPPSCLQRISVTGPPCNGQHPISVTALADGSRAYVADDRTNSVCVLNTTSNTFTKSIPVGTAPLSIASDLDSRRVLTANSGAGDVSIIETDTDAPVPGNNGPLTIPTFGSPTFIGIAP